MFASGDDGVSVVSKPWGLGRRFLTAALMFITLGFIVFAVAGSNAEGRVAGAGSTLVDPILQRVSTAYQGYLAADRVDLTAQTGESGDWTGGAGALDYDPVGSIGGLVRLADPAVAFAATEVPMTNAELEEKGLVQFPLILGAAAPVVNLDLKGDLVLDAGVLAGIYEGKITNWNDPAITALNPDLAMPDQAIAVRHRRDGSGTTYTFTGYLAQSEAWTKGQAAQVDWAVGNAADGSRGMIAAVKADAGAIGYAEVGQARRAGLTVVKLLNGAGKVMEPTAPEIRTAAAGSDWTADKAAPSKNGWPMTAMVHVVMRAEADATQTKRVLNFFDYFYAEAPRRADALGYVTLPEQTVDAVKAHWASHFNVNS